MSSAYERLLERVHEINDLGKIVSLLNWDRQVMMPPGGEADRVRQITTLRSLLHRMQTSAEVGELIEAADASLSGAPYASDAASLIRLLKRTYDDNRKLPPDFVRRVSEVSGRAHGAWVKARANDDFAAFRPWLEQVVALGQEMSELYGYDAERYDPLLDKFEHGMTTAVVRELFEATKAGLVALREAIVERGRPVDDAILHQPYPISKQKEFCRYIATAVGYDFERGHLGTAVHPFATSFSRNDARITTRWYPDFLNPALFGTLHEAGHALYEQGTAPALARTPLARGTSSGIHESQSRMFENYVGRDAAFWRVHYGKLQACFPEQLGAVTRDAFHRAINKVQPSYIRVEADEVTYSLHIILRFELEQDLLNGELVVADLPAAWNEKMRSLIGVVPPTDREGVLQDVHWSRPSFGYFPTYALGNLYAAQFYAAARAQEPAVAQGLEVGDPAALLAWLRENIHVHGKKFTAAEIVESATGEPLSHRPYLDYLQAKFSEIYAL